ncbi:MAG: four-carbon acid sugar kinase family protein [Rubrivivax sp.]
MIDRSSKRLRIVADDLTGALDAAVGFVAGVGPVQVCRSAAAARDVDCAAIDIGTRDLPACALGPVLAATAGLFDDADLSFKKVDSLLRGHWAAELAFLWARGRFDRCVVAPAFPQQGRITAEGCLFVRDPVGAWAKAEGLSIVEALQRVGIACPERRTVSAAAAPFDGVAVFDVGSAQALSTLARAGLGWPGRTLWVGSAGLARALVGVPVPLQSMMVAPVLFVIGSAHPRTVAQVARLQDVAGEHVVRHRPEDALASTALGVRKRLHGPGRAAALCFDFPAGTSTASAEQMIAEVIAGLVREVERPATLVATGGQTLAKVCDAVGCSRLHVQAEWAPGIVFSRMDDGTWAGCQVLSKSGAFGGRELLAEFLQRL